MILKNARVIHATVNHNNYDISGLDLKKYNFQQIAEAELVIIKFENGTEKIIKNRYGATGFILKNRHINF